MGCGGWHVPVSTPNSRGCRKEDFCVSRRLSAPLPASGWGEGPQERQKPETSIQGNGEKGPGWTLKGERRPAHLHALLYCTPARLAALSCPTLCDPMDCNPPGSSVHGILQAKNTEVGCCFLLHLGVLSEANLLSMFYCFWYVRRIDTFIVAEIFSIRPQ